MSDDLDFISSMQTLADNGTLHELLRRIEDIHTQDWKVAVDPARREKCWQAIDAINELRHLIKSLSNPDKVREFNTRLRRVS